MSAPAPAPVRLDDLADRINAEHAAAAGAARTAIGHAVVCGRLLLEAKAGCRHGVWLDWLETHTTVSPRQSQRYMRLAAHAAELAGKYDTVSHLGMRRALALLSAPDDDGEEPDTEPDEQPPVGLHPDTPRHLQPESRDVPVAQILIGPRLRRRRQELVDLLAESMESLGELLQPLVIGRIAPDTYQVICGRHRLEAAIQLGWDTVPCLVTRNTDRREWQLAEIEENLVRGELSPAERALDESRHDSLVERIAARRAGEGRP